MGSALSAADRGMACCHRGSLKSTFVPEPESLVAFITPGSDNTFGCPFSLTDPNGAAVALADCPARVRASPKTLSGLELTGVKQDA